MAAKQKKSTMEDLRTRSEDQLGAQLVDLKREALNLRFQAATGQLERPARMREVRREIARIKTLQNQRQTQSGRDAAGAAAKA